MAGNKNSGNKSGYRRSGWEIAHGLDAGEEKRTKENQAAAKKWNNERLAEKKKAKLAKQREENAMPAKERQGLHNHVNRLAVVKRPALQGLLSGDPAGNKPKRQRQLGSDGKSIQHQKAALAKSAKNRKTTCPRCGCRPVHGMPIYSVLKKTYYPSDDRKPAGTQYYSCPSWTSGGVKGIHHCGFFMWKSDFNEKN